MEKIVYHELKFNTINSQLLRGYDWEEVVSIIEESYKNLFTRW